MIGDPVIIGRCLLAWAIIQQIVTLSREHNIVTVVSICMGCSRLEPFPLPTVHGSGSHGFDFFIPVLTWHGRTFLLASPMRHNILLQSVREDFQDRR
ncbi:MAG: hypothetical protein ACERLB_12625 [Gammaproteobacteria bacterium]